MWDVITHPCHYFNSNWTQWGREMHICVGKLTIIASDNGLSPWRRQAIIWTNAGILLIGPLGTNFNEILIAIHTFSFKKMQLKMSSAKWRPFCLSLNVLTVKFRAWMTNFIPTFYENVIMYPCYNLNTLRPRQNGRHLPDNIFKFQLHFPEWKCLNSN